MTNGLGECLFVFGFEAWELDIPEELHGCRAREDDRMIGSISRGIVYLGRGYFVVRNQGLGKNLSWITRGLRLRFSAF